MEKIFLTFNIKIFLWLQCPSLSSCHDSLLSDYYFFLFLFLFLVHDIISFSSLNIRSHAIIMNIVISKNPLLLNNSIFTNFLHSISSQHLLCIFITNAFALVKTLRIKFLIRIRVINSKSFKFFWKCFRINLHKIVIAFIITNLQFRLIIWFRDTLNLRHFDQR